MTERAIPNGGSSVVGYTKNGVGIGAGTQVSVAVAEALGYTSDAIMEAVERRRLKPEQAISAALSKMDAGPSYAMQNTADADIKQSNNALGNLNHKSTDRSMS